MTDLEVVRGLADGRQSVFDLGADQISRRIKRAAPVASLDERYRGHSQRCGLTRDLTKADVVLPRLMISGRWRSFRMPAL